MAVTPTGAVVALKQLDLAKSRFAGVDPALRERLALAMLSDTCAALAPAVERLLVVTAAPGLRTPLRALGAEVVADPGGGLNAAYAVGDELLRGAGCARVLASVADLPALRTADVAALLADADDRGRRFVRDHTGLGTTMLVATGGPLDPRFEHGSARRHEDSGAVPVPVDAPGARLDVDHADDLPAAARLGLGPATAALWSSQDRLCGHDTGTVAAATAEGWTVVRSGGSRVTVPAAALAPELAALRPTQRVHLALDGPQVRRVWI